MYRNQIPRSGTEINVLFKNCTTPVKDDTISLFRKIKIGIKTILYAHVYPVFIFLGKVSFSTNVSTSISFFTDISKSRFRESWKNHESFRKHVTSINLCGTGGLQDILSDYILYCLVTIHFRTVCLRKHCNADDARLLLNTFVTRGYTKITVVIIT